MSTFYQTVISIISKPSDNRNDDEINFILNWFINLFKKKPSIFGDVTAEVIKDIIKNCSFETVNRDDIIIKQGDVGDCFYINLRGKVSIFINHSKHDENDNLYECNQNNNHNGIDSSKENFDELIEGNALSNEKKSKNLREKLGNYVTSLGVGEGFGEYALINSEPRNASIIADELTDLMVVNKQLYARCLQSSTLRKLDEKKSFINSSSFFGNWSTKMKKLLSMCLERDFLSYDSCLGKQGEPLDKIYFIIKGQVKITVNSQMHKSQYPNFYPLKLPENQEQDLINSWIEEKVNSSNSKNQIRFSSLNQNNSNYGKKLVVKRRNETFAEAEQRLKFKNIEVGIVGPGEITGMCEAIFKMNSYMYTTKCIEDCDVYYIYKRNFDRLITKRNPNCIRKMRDNVYLKLKARNQRLSTPVQLFRSIQFRIEQIKKKNNFQNYNIIDENEIVINENLIDIKNEKIYNQAPRGSIIRLDSKCKSSAYFRFQNVLDVRNRKKIENERKLEIAIKSINSWENKEEESNENDNFLYSNNEETKIKDIIKNKYIMTDDPNNLALVDLEDRIKQFHLDLGCRKVLVTKLNRIDKNKIKIEIKTGENVYLKKLNNLDSYNNSNSDSNNTNIHNSSTINLSDDEYNRIPTLTNSMQSANKRVDLNRDSFKLNTNSISNSQQLLQLNYGILMNVINPLDINHISENTSFLNGVETKANIYEIIRNNDNDNNIFDIHLNNGCNNQLSDSLYLNERNYNEYNNKTVLIKKKLLKNNNEELTSSQIEEKSLEIGKNNLVYNKEETRIKKNSMPNLTCNPSFQLTSINNNSNNNDPFSSYVIGRKFSLGQIKIQRSGKAYSKEEYIALKDLLRKQTKRFNANPINM